MRAILGIIVILAISGCYPVYKTLQPNAKMIVVDNEGKPIEEAVVVLVSNSYPYGFEKTRMTVKTNPRGEASFPKIKEWRVEALMIHGAEIYFWNWCVLKKGYATFLTYHGSSRDFEKNAKIVLNAGESEACPAEFR